MSGILIRMNCFLQVGRLVHAIKMGWIKPKVKKDENEDQFYQLWADDDQVRACFVEEDSSTPEILLLVRAMS